jgi:hypothetical protein
LLDGVKFVLPLFAERKILTAEFAPAFGRFTRTAADGFDNFRFRRAAFHALFAGVFGQADRLHRFISSKTR